MYTNDQRMATLQKSPSPVVDFYCGMELTRIIKNMMLKSQITNSLFVDLVGDRILGLYSGEQFEAVLVAELALSTEIAHSIAMELEQHIGNIRNSPPLQGESASLVRTALPHSEVAPTPLTRDQLMKALEYKPLEKMPVAQMTEKLKAVATEPKIIGYDSQPPRNPQ